MYNNYDSFRFEDAEEFDCLSDTNEIYELETWDLPPYCPYRQSFQYRESTGNMSRMPNPNIPGNPPPSFIPTKEQAQIQFGPPGSFGLSGSQLKTVEPITLRRCMFRFVYIWPRRGRGFWAWLTYVGRRSASGYRWDGRRWVYFGIDLRQIESFTCR